MDIIESIDNLQVQDPPGEDFCSTDLDWVKLRSAERCDDVALIPYDRVDAFIIGECSNVECPTRFHIERGRKRPVGSLKEYKNDEYLEYKRDIETHVTSDFRKNSKKKYQEIILFHISENCIIFHWGVNRHVCEIADMYWCSFGPENYGEGGGTLPSRRYRLNTRSRAARPQSMRGCQCHFVVKRLYARPSLALLIYNCRRHVNKAGAVCHGPLDKDAIGPGAKQIPYVSSEIQQQTMSMIYLGIPEENVLAKHIEGIQRYCGSDPKVQTVASQYVQKLGMIIKRSTHELDLDDQVSIRLWVERNKKSIFFYRDTSDDDPFILGIQTEWQLQQMIRFGHHNIIAVDSTFGIKRLKYPLCTLLVFDSRQHALPVAWIITRSIAKPDVAIWMKALLGRVQSVEPGWKANGFLIDDAAAEINSIRETFSCPVLFSLWRVRRSWLRHIVKKCTNIEVQREIFRRLGQIVYGIWGGKDLAVSFEELLLDFVDQTSFMQYFKDSWLPKIEMWLKLMKTLPLASQEASGAIEAYHVKLKTKLYEDSQLDSLQRVDWLVHKLMTDMHSSYWLDRYADESDLFPTVKEDYLASISWHRALQIPEASVSFDKDYQLFAKVVSRKDSTLSRIVWNPGSEFAHCDCEWSLQGNLCKHVVKVNMICGNMPCYQSSLSFQSLKTILMDLWKKPMDDSVALDISTALTFQVLDQVQKLVELKDSKDIGLVVKNMPVKWGAKQARKSSGRQSPVLELPGTSKSNAARISRKRKKRLYHR